MNEGKSRRILGFPDEFWIGFVILIGIFLKLVYDVAAGYAVSTHDLGEWVEIINDIPNRGHLGVIQYYFTYHRLPNFDPSLISGYSNPPLFYIMSALVLEIFFKNLGWSLGTVLHCIQCLNAVFVMVGSFAGIGILSKFGVRGRKSVVGLLFMMFFPGFYNLGAAMDNTAMSFMFMMLALNTGLKWYQIRARKTLIKSAVFMALGMMAKLSSFVVIFPIAVLFASAHFYDRRSSYEQFYKELGLYAAIALIPGLFYPVRNLIRFGTSPFYMDIDKEPWQLVSTYSFGRRIGLPSIPSLVHLHLTKETFYEYNIWGQTFKTAIVDEQALNLTLKVTHALAVILLFAVILFTLLSLIMLVRAMIGNRLSPEHKGVIAAGLLGILIVYIIRCFMNPTVSAMNFRQIPVVIIFLLAGYGLCGREDDLDNLFERVTSRAGDILILIISILSAFLFGFYAL